MTKQHRFTMYQNTIYDDGDIIIPFECMKLLNKLNDENEELKGDVEYWKNRFKEEEWHYEYIDEDRDVWHYKCTQLEKENERLRNDIKLLQEENDDLDKFFLHNCKTSDYLKWKKGDME